MHEASLYFGWLCVAVTCLVPGLVPGVVGYPTGAPDMEEVCRGMVPKHGVGPQPHDASLVFTVIPAAGEVYPGGNLTVSLGGWAFKGFLLQARIPGEETMIGSWDAEVGTKEICNGKALTHVSSEGNIEITPTWRAPPDWSGTVEIVATVVQFKTKYWTMVKSQQVTVVDSSKTPQGDGGSDSGTGGGTETGTGGKETGTEGTETGPGGKETGPGGDGSATGGNDSDGQGGGTSPTNGSGNNHPTVITVTATLISGYIFLLMYMGSVIIL